MRCFLVLLMFLNFVNSFYKKLDTRNISAPCMKQIEIMQNNENLAWQMFDSSSKSLTPGITYSNNMDLGNFPQCLSINYQNGQIIGKYCGLSVVVVNVFQTSQNLKVSANETLYYLDLDLSGSDFLKINSIINAQMEKILHQTNSFTLSMRSLCLPDACTPQEMKNFYFFGLPGIKSTFVLFTNFPCETVNSNQNYKTGDIVVILIFLLLVLIVISSTVYDALCQNFRREPYHPILLSFSILYNGKKLFQVTNTTEQIHCFNGMRSISTMWIVAFHSLTHYRHGVFGLENFPKMKQWERKWTSRYILSAYLAVDTFFFISGFLLSFGYLKKTREKIINIPKMYLHRYLRLTPAVAAVYLVIITIYRFLGSGPTWTLITNFMKNTCEDKWWKFFLYIQNYTDPDEMCITPMWYLSADMQMHVLAPFVLIPVGVFIKKHFKMVIQGLVILTVILILVPMLLRYFVNKGPGNTSNTHERFCDFLIGITFGAIMRMKKHKPYIFGPWSNFGLWLLVIGVSIALALYWTDVENNYDLIKYTIFMGLYRPIWCLCLGFIVYSCYHNHGGFIQWFLTRPIFQILGKLSYSMYVIHILVETYFVATLKTNTYFSNYTLIYDWCGHIVITMLMAIIWVFAIEFPMNTIDKFILKGTYCWHNACIHQNNIVYEIA